MYLVVKLVRPMENGVRGGGGGSSGPEHGATDNYKLNINPTFFFKSIFGLYFCASLTTGLIYSTVQYILIICLKETVKQNLIQYMHYQILQDVKTIFQKLFDSYVYFLHPNI